MSGWWHAHVHSTYSAQDGMPRVEDLVATAVENGQPALGLTDHGIMGGSLALYRHCRKAGIAPLAVVLVATLPSVAVAESEAAAGLKILLTNDDGYQSPGIQALREALSGAGHEVVLVAPEAMADQIIAWLDARGMRG